MCTTEVISGLFLILFIVGKFEIVQCNRKLGNMETCIEQLKEMRKVEETNMPDSHSKLCGGQYSYLVLFYSTARTFIMLCSNKTIRKHI